MMGTSTPSGLRQGLASADKSEGGGPKSPVSRSAVWMSVRRVSGAAKATRASVVGFPDASLNSARTIVRLRPDDRVVTLTVAPVVDKPRRK